MAEKYEHIQENKSTGEPVTARSPGEIPDMHELLATASPAERAMAEMERLMNSYQSDEVPKPHQEDTRHYIEATTGRKQPLDEIQDQGSFYTKGDPRDVALVTIGIMAPYAALVILALVYLTPAINMLGLNMALIIIIEVIIFCILSFLVFYQCITKIHGPLHNYKADGRGFYVSVKGKGEEQILFKDVLSVDYSPTKLLWGKRGYKVDIVLTYGVVHYDYIFPKFNQRVHLENLPFDVIIRNAPDQKKGFKGKRSG